MDPYKDGGPLILGSMPRVLKLRHPERGVVLTTRSSAQVDLAELLIWLNIPLPPTSEGVLNTECHAYMEAAEREDIGYSYSKHVQSGRHGEDERHFKARWINIHGASAWLLNLIVSPPTARYAVLTFDFEALAKQVAQLWRDYILAQLAPLEEKKRYYDALLAEIDEDLK
jgi:hypothetical protein